MNLLKRMLRPRQRDDGVPVRRANEPLAALLARSGESDERGQAFAPAVYGDYYATTVPIYRAIKLRADAVARARLKVFLRMPDDTLEWAGEDHAVQRLLDRVNPWWSRSNWWRGIETYLSLWGSAFSWVNKTGTDPGQWEIWPLRPDKVVVVRDKAKYIRGFVFDPSGAQFAMLPEEVLWNRYFNPLDEHAGFSPIAPLRLTADMRNDMLRTNRELFRNGVLAQNMAFILKGAVDQYELDEFHERLNERYGSAAKANKPLVLQQDLADIKNLGFSNREMEWLAGLDVTRNEIVTALAVPEELLPGATQTTFANREEARREFYENTISQEWAMLESDLQEMLVPMLPAEFRKIELRFDKEGIEALEENLDRLSERKRAELAAGGISLDEFRQAIGEDELPGGAGQVLYVPIAVVPVPLSDVSVSNGTNGQNGGQEGLHAPVLRALPPAAPDDETVWRAFIERTDHQSKNFADLQRDLFERQRIDVIRELRRQRRQNEPNAFDETKWRAIYTDEGRPQFEAIVDANAKAQISEFSLGVAFDVQNPVSQAWIDQRAAFWAQHVNEETGKLLLEEIRVGVAEGESIRALEGRVGKVFDFSEGFRTERIARTEVTSAANQGHLDAYRRADIPSKKWVTTVDGRQRDAHAAANGQIVAREESFTVGGEALMAPGQGSARNSVNCRCTTVPVMEDFAPPDQSEEFAKAFNDAPDFTDMDDALKWQADMDRRFGNSQQYKDFREGLDTWQGAGSAKIRENIRRGLEGKGDDTFANAFFKVANAGPRSDKTLFRGIKVAQTPDEVIAAYRNNPKFMVDASSFSSDINVARAFSAPTQAQPTRVIMAMEKGAKGTKIQGFSPEADFLWEAEWISAGRMELVRAVQTDIDTVSLVFRQVGNFALKAWADWEAPPDDIYAMFGSFAALREEG